MTDSRGRWMALAIVFITRTSMGYQFQALPGGILGQRLGERRTVVGSLALMIAGAVITASAHGYAAALAGRVLAGIGAVLMNVLLAKMVADWFTEGGMSTAMAIMLTSWPVGLGLASATIGGLATRTSWRTAILVTAAVSALGLVLIAFVYRDPPRRADGATAPAACAGRLSGWEIALGSTGGFAWGCFNASLVAVIAFGPGLLTARGLSLADAGYVVSAAILLTMVSVPLGGLLIDRVGRPNLVIVAGSIVAAGVIRDVSGSAAAPVLFAALVMALTVLGLASFRLIEHASRRPAAR